MNSDLVRLGGAVTVSLLAGLYVGNIFAGLSAGLVFCLFWQYRMLQRIRRVLHKGDATAILEAPGIFKEIFRAIEDQRANQTRREETLRDVLLRFEEATEALPDAVVIMDADRHIEWANKKAAEYLGVKLPKDRGQPFPHLFRHPRLLGYLDEENRSETDENLVIQSPLDAGTSLEIRLIQYADSSLLLVARNVTEIQQANLMRKDFIANASHELRTPLTVISGYLEALDNEVDSMVPEWLPRVRQMRSQARRMQRLVDDLLRLSQVESGPAADVDNEVDMNGLLSMIRDEAQILSGEQQHNFSLEVDQELLLKGDEDNLYSAFSNIIFNAVQYTPARGFITIKWWRQADRGACLAVRDTGEGIPKEYLHRVSERFYRIDKGRSREKGGTGLGLAIARHVMAQHDAELIIASEPGQGTTVTCVFPERRVIPANHRQPRHS